MATSRYNVYRESFLQMSIKRNCPECGGSNLFSHGNIDTRGGYGPDLLPGTSGIFKTAKMRAIVCTDCGNIRYFLQKESLDRISSDHGWNRLI